MFGKLLESRSKPSRSKRGLAASVGAHLGLVGLAVYGTASATIPDDAPVERTIHWVETTPVAAANHSAPAPSVASPSRATRAATSAVPAISIVINPTLPDINLQLGAIRASDFDSSAPSAGQRDSSGTPGHGRGSGIAAYNAADVDTPASLQHGGSAPEYPPSLRNANIEGSVTLQFVVGTDGRARTGSARVLSATNVLFAASVLQSLPRMRFVPAGIGGKPVAQTVQQLFAFRLDR